MEPTPACTASELLERLAACAGVFDSLGPDGDPVDLLDHGLQCAHELVATAPADEELQVAGLIHDLGHAIDGWHALDHGEVGAAYVRPLLGDRVARLVALHVPAKRYLVTVDGGYAVSTGSARSLALQGGPMRADEVAAFARVADAEAATTLRRADEAAKVVGREVPGLDRWAPVVRRVAAS